VVNEKSCKAAAGGAEVINLQEPMLVNVRLGIGPTGRLLFALLFMNVKVQSIFSDIYIHI